MTVAMTTIRRGLYVVFVTAGLASWLALQIPGMGTALTHAAPSAAESAAKASLRQLEQAACARASAAFSRLPLSFAASPSGSPAKFSARASGGNLYLSATAATFELPSGARVQRPDRVADSGMPRNAGSQLAVHQHPGPRRDQAAARATLSADLHPPAPTVRMKLIGGNPRAPVTGADELAGKRNDFIGNDAAQWRTQIPTYARVRVENVYRGVDVIYYGQGRALEYDFKVAAGADCKAIRLRFDGATAIRIDESGDLLIDTAAGEMRQHQPVAYQFIDGARREVAARYLLKGKREVGFSIGAYDKRLPLVIDPVLAYSTFFGGDGEDVINSVALDSQGNTYVAGTTDSSDLPITPGALQLPGDIQSISSVGFIAKFDLANNALVYSTYLGGSKPPVGSFVSNDCRAIAVDSSGSAYVTGKTNAANFPTTAGAFQAALAGGSSDAFVAKLNATGTALVYSTYLGSSKSSDTIHLFSDVGLDEGVSIAVDPAGRAYVTGRTTGNDFPTTPGALKTTHNNDVFPVGDVDPPTLAFADVFITKLNPTGTALLYSTYLGGRGADAGSGIAIDLAGNAYVVGTTEARDFPTFNALQATLTSRQDAFVAKLNPDGNALVYSTYLGGSGDDTGKAIALDQAGNAYVTGMTSSTDLPTTAGAFQRTSAGGNLFKSTDGGASWVASSVGIPRNYSLDQVIVDPADSANVYANADGLIFNSTDGGQHWKSATDSLSTNSGFQPTKVLAFDPKKPSTIYASSDAAFLPPRLFKSLDGGRTWTIINTSFPSTQPLLTFFALAVDPVNPSTLYVSTNQGLFRTTDEGLSWEERDEELFDESNFLAFLAIDPTNSSKLFAQVAGVLFISTNGGKKWARTSLGDAFIISLAFASVTSTTVYAGGDGLFRSTDRGNSWQEIETDLPDIGPIVIDPINSVALYTVAPAGVFKSTNRGGHWAAINNGLKLNPALQVSLVTALAIDPRNSSTLYATASGAGPTGFIAKLDPSGAGFTYFTYLGGSDDDRPSGIAVDMAGNAYVTGPTGSEDFPLKNALQRGKLCSDDVFITKLNADGASLAYSTYLGGSGFDVSSGIALDGAGNAYVAGYTFSGDYPLVSPLLPLFRELDGFISKIVDTVPPLSPPTILSVDPPAGAATGQYTININGISFRPGARVYFDGLPATVINQTSERITARVNAHRPGIVSVAVINPGAQGAVL